MSQQSHVVTREEVAHLAHLARVNLTEEELTQYASQIDEILTAVHRVSEVAAEDVPPMSHAVSVENVMREDTPRPSLDRTEVLAVAPEVEQHRFRVPRILDGEES